MSLFARPSFSGIGRLGHRQSTFPTGAATRFIVTEAADESDMEEFSAGRGILVGLALAVPLWAGIGAGVWMLFR